MSRRLHRRTHTQTGSQMADGMAQSDVQHSITTAWPHNFHELNTNNFTSEQISTECVQLCVAEKVSAHSDSELFLPNLPE